MDSTGARSITHATRSLLIQYERIKLAILDGPNASLSFIYMLAGSDDNQEVAKCWSLRIVEQFRQPLCSTSQKSANIGTDCHMSWYVALTVYGRQSKFGQSVRGVSIGHSNISTS